jgi:hypothetical protein
MLRILASMLFSIVFLILTACASPDQDRGSPSATVNPGQTVNYPSNTPTVTPSALPKTQFSQMLDLVPYSFLEKHDVWFGDQKAAMELAGIRDVNSQEALVQRSSDQRKRIGTALQGIAGMFSSNNWQKIAPITGYDIWSIECSIFVNTPPPWAFYVSEGKFDKDVIIGKLTDLGYQKIDYGSYSYYKINDDFSRGQPSNPVSEQVSAAMNRVAIIDNTIVIAPATDIMTGILDTLTGTAMPVTGDPACKALLSSLGEVLSGVLMNPERTLNLNHPQKMPPFKFTIPPDWGILHQYDMTGIGFKNDGKERYWVISLYYKDAQDTAADADILASRMKNYIFNTHLNQSPGQTLKPVPLTDKFEVGQPVVQLQSGEVTPAATLTIECRYKSETAGGYWQIPIIETRDLLFLAPDPSAYITEK